MNNARADGELAFATRLETEKLAALAEFAAGAGHEINNPLAVISGRAQLLLADEADPERRRELAVIHRQALRVREMIADLMHFARPPQPRLAPIIVSELLSEVVARAKPRAATANVRLTLEPAEPPLTLSGDRQQLSVALAAVVDNALDAATLPAERRLSEITFSATGSEDADAAWIALCVADDGPGFDADVRRHLFDPYFSGRAAGRGLGLGLSKCWRIVTLHGGRMQVDSEPGEGAAVTLMLPAAVAVAQ